jgi:outer membrane protein TolC
MHGLNLNLYLLSSAFLLSSLSLFAELPLNDLSLQDAENIAKEYNKQLLIAKEGTEQAKERKYQAVSRWLPSLNYRGEFRDIEKKELFLNVFSSLKPFTPSHRGYSSILELAQPIFSTDLIFNLKSKQIEAEAVQYEQANTLNELLLAVRRSYYSVVVYETALTIERENIAYLSFALEQEQGKLDAGNSTTLEVNQSKVAVANAISLYYSTLKDLKNARNAFILTLGIDPLLESKIYLSQRQVPIHSIPEIALKLQEVDSKYSYLSNKIPSTQDFLNHIDRIENAKSLILFSEGEVLDYLELALSHRPDLRKSQLQVDVAGQNLKEKQGHYFPRVEGYARYSYNDQYLGGEPFGSEQYNWSGGLVLTWNLFDSLLREHEIKEARSLRQSYRLNYDKNFQKIEVEIRNGLYQLEEAMMAYLSSSQAVFVAEQARCQAADKLKFGRIAPLEYRDSVNLLLQARNQNNLASFDLIFAYYQLRYSTGTDVDSGF